jgi:hypothetical protein
VAASVVFCARQVMASAVRIITINHKEEALIRVNSNRPITLEFPGHLVSVYEQDGLIFQRVEKQDSTYTQELFEPAADMENTQKLDLACYEKIEETQLEDDSGETQLEDCGSPVVFNDFPDIPQETPDDLITIDVGLVCNLRRMSIHLSRLDMEDISALQEELFN